MSEATFFFTKESITRVLRHAHLNRDELVASSSRGAGLDLGQHTYRDDRRRVRARLSVRRRRVSRRPYHPVQLVSLIRDLLMPHLVLFEIPETQRSAANFPSFEWV